MKGIPSLEETLASPTRHGGEEGLCAYIPLCSIKTVPVIGVHTSLKTSQVGSAYPSGTYIGAHHCHFRAGQEGKSTWRESGITSLG